MEAPAGLPKLGYTWHSVQLTNPTSPDATPGGYGTSVGIESTPCTFKHYARVASSGGIRGLVSAAERRALFVRNVSGTILFPGQVVNWTNGFRGRRVGALSAAAGYNVAGVVDYYLPSTGVRDGDLFWLFVRGPVEMKFDNGLTVLNNGVIVGTTSGNGKDKAGAYAAGTDLGFVRGVKTVSASDPFAEVDLVINW